MAAPQSLWKRHRRGSYLLEGDTGMDMTNIADSAAGQKEILVERIKAHQATIGIVGMGYVGLPLVLRFSEIGFKVVGFDIDEQKVEALGRSKSYIKQFPSSRIAEAVESGFEPTVDFRRAADVDAIIVCVPTPLDKHREPDLSYVTNTIDALAPYLRPGHVLSLESTTYPGTTDEEVASRVAGRGLTVGEDVFVVYSPEREDPGNADFSIQSIPKICGGVTPACLEVGMALYTQIIDRVVPVSSTRAAELTKLLENIHRAVNIGLVNEMKVIADKMGIDIHEVIRAAATKPFGFVAYYPGPGLGGHCIPIDPFYLTWKAREFGVHSRFIELAGEVNASMPDYVVTKVAAALNSRRKSIAGSSVLVLGVAYKKNVDDMRESPSVTILELLRSMGAEIAYSDPNVAKFPKLRTHSDLDLVSIEVTPEALASYDCVVLATDHDEFDYRMIKDHSRLIVDTRGKYLEPAEHIFKS